jgi:PAS domain S-box-containing protein
MKDSRSSENSNDVTQELEQELKNYQDAIQVHQHVERKAEETDQIFRLILESISETVYLVDKEGDFLFIPKTDKILGFTWEEAKKMGNIFKLVSNNSFNPDSLNFSGETKKIETNSISKSGKTTKVLINVRKTDFRRGVILIILSKLSDINN